MTQVTDEVRAVLEAATITETSVKLNGQLERKLYEQVNKVLVDVGGEWDRKAGAHVFGRDPRELLAGAIATGVSTNVKTELQAFYTPADVVQMMVELASLEPMLEVLEPSAGEGAIASAIEAAEPSPEGLLWQFDPRVIVGAQHLPEHEDPAGRAADL